MSNLPFTQAPAEPQLKDVLDQLRKNIFLSLNCHHIGTIQSFDPAKQTATATINYKKTIYRLGSDGIYVPVLFDYPILTDCPVQIVGGGNAALTMPITAGDECLISFNDRDLDNWFQGANGAPVASTRQHHFADAIIFVGINSMANVLSAYDPIRAVLRNGDAMVGVGTSLVKIANSDFTLNGILQDIMTQLGDLCTAIQALTVTCATPGNPSSPPINSAQFATISSALSGLATDLGDLLE
jgi:hypothetical protein